MVERNLLRSKELRRYSSVRTYEIVNADGKMEAETVVRFSYEAPGKKTFAKTSEEGSAIVRNLVIDRLIRSEDETASGRKHHNSAITPANYAFKFAGEENVGSNHCFVFDAIPRRREEYLFEGKIWIDAEDFAIAKISGHPAKKPSFWVNAADFVRQYQKIDGFWLPYRDETRVEVKLYGQKIFTIDYRQYIISSASADQSETDERNVPD